MSRASSGRPGTSGTSGTSGTLARSLAAAAVTALLVAAGVGSALAQAGPKGAASAGYPQLGSASGSASALPPEDPPAASGKEPWIPRFDVPPIPDQPSAKPDKHAWKDAPIAREARVTEPGCEVRRIREWYRIECQNLAIQLNAGRREDVELGGFKESADDRAFSRVWAIFPARRGDRRYFQIYRWAKWAPGDPDAQASEQWLEGDPLPLITVQGLRWGF